MKNEPVAWMLNGILHDFDPSDWAKEQYPDQDVIPLYTHSAKTLTDEEIKQIFQEQTGFFFDDSPADNLALMDFARAILRKAQEK